MEKRELKNGKINNGVLLWKRAKKIIPGGSQLLSKRAEMFLPDQWPAYFAKAKGVNIWDLDGNKYVDMSLMGFCVLGYADADVDRAVISAIRNGSTSTLNSPEEVELTELLLKLHPWAGMARYARTGGEAMAIATRIARAYSGKDKVAFCGYHGWSDWYIAANLATEQNLDGHLLPGLKAKGVPRGLKGTALPFRYNNIKELEKIVAKNKDIGVIVLEPLRHEEPKDDFLNKVRMIANSVGAVLIFDEITIGWRMNLGGVHLLYRVNPDICVFGKAISNCYPFSAIIGKKKIMQAAQQTFISSTNWTERVGFVAALATIKKMQARNIPAYLNQIGGMIVDGLKNLAEKHSLKMSILCPNPIISFLFEYGKDSQAIRTLFTQEMLRYRFLASNTIYVTYSHSSAHVANYLKACDRVFGFIAKAIDEHKVRKLLKGAIAHSDFKRLI